MVQTAHALRVKYNCDVTGKGAHGVTGIMLGSRMESAHIIKKSYSVTVGHAGESFLYQIRRNGT